MSEEIQEGTMPEGSENAGFNVLDFFKEQASSGGLGAGIHNNVRLISADPERRKDNNGNLIKKQLFLKFKKFDKNGTDIGEKEISFFLVDPTKDSAINNLHSFLSQIQELLSIYYTQAEIDESFDPIGVLYTEGDEFDESTFTYDNIKGNHLKKAKSYTAVEKAACEQFASMVEDKIGFESETFRFKLEESQDAKYIQIPRFDRFVEKMSVDEKKSVLTK